MKKQSKMTQILALLVPVVLMLMLFSACEKEVEKIVTKTVTDTVTVHDTLTVRDTIRVEIIMVDAINANPDSISQGGTIQLTANVTTAAGAGSELSYVWTSPAGHFDMTTNDTVNWTAPDDEGAYPIVLQVTDGTYAGVGTKLIGVGMYAPTVTPYFVGNNCEPCHSGTRDGWSHTGHAGAWEGLQTSGHPAPYCNRCHTVTDNPTEIPGNAGYDDAPIMKYENVQCESCHGPGSDHVAAPSAANIEVSYDAMNCGKCHEGTHHPYMTEWEASPHNLDPYAHSSASCSGCHEGVASAIRLSGDLSTFYGGGSVATRPDTLEQPWRGIVCQTCHTSHDADNIGQVRTVADVPLVTANNESPVITLGGSGKLCMHCHHARRGAESQIANGYAHFGPHANPQADMMAGKSGFHGVADPSFAWATPSHLNVQNSCKTCHLNMAEFNGTTAVTGHTFLPTVEACQSCHGAISDFDDIVALEDFDGDGNIEGVQSEVLGLMHLLEGALITSGLDTTGGGFAHALGDTLLSTELQREAGWNLVYLEDDKSLGIHNPDYAVQLLQQSILHLGGILPESATIVVEANKVVAPF